MANAYDRVREQLSGGGELTLEAMDEYQRMEMGRKTYEFCCRVLRQNPELREEIKKRDALIRAEGVAEKVETYSNEES